MALLAFVFATDVGCRRSSTPSEIISEAPISFCDLVQRPDDYNSKTVRVRGTLVGYHEMALYDSTCDPNIKFIRAEFDVPNRRKLVDAIAALGSAGMQRGNIWVEVVITGRFERIPGADCQKNSIDSGIPGRRYVNYCYRLVVSDVAQVTAVPANVEWPK